MVKFGPEDHEYKKAQNRIQGLIRRALAAPSQSQGSSTKILGQMPRALQDLVDTYEQKRKKSGKPGGKWQWHQEELRLFFQSSIPKVLETRAVWLFVDALDECGEENAVRLADEFMFLLESLPLSASERLRICFNCRHYLILDPNGAFEALHTLPDGVFGSGYNYPPCRGHFHVGASRGGARSEPESHRGIFTKIKAKVNSVPVGLNDVYNGLVESMDNTTVSLQLIQWICFAMRPLSLDELRWVMIVDAECPYRTLQECRTSGDYACNCDDECGCDVMERRVKTLSCGLAEIVSSSKKLYVQFIHQSVKDFFLKRGLS
ncbi:vegetative incompatibility protein HET-E-1 [Hirsutella rhossiliensis]